MAAAQETRKFHFWTAFKNFAIIFSFVVNFILVLVLLLSPGPLLMAKAQLVEPLLGDLDEAFRALGDTDIQTTVDIDDEIPVQFTLQLDQVTDVILVEPVPLNVPATFQLPGWGGAINGTVSLNLPVSMTLPVALSLEVPVDESVPVQMEVDVVIGLNEAGMGPAIDQLRGVFSPINVGLQSLPDTPAGFLKKADE
ncbi:MAG TPA: hypothetical protein G4N98_01080 [Thermoflexia bacterium]|nr:hypothetical protein [Thermoflexia bacterium]